MSLTDEHVCSDCTIRLHREAKEWGTYKFWSCADVEIVAAAVSDGQTFTWGIATGFRA